MKLVLAQTILAGAAAVALGVLALTSSVMADPSDLTDPSNASDVASPTSPLNMNNPANMLSPQNPANLYNPANPFSPANPDNQDVPAFNPFGVLSGAYSRAGLCRLGDATCPDPRPEVATYPDEANPAEVAPLSTRHHRRHRRHRSY